MVVKVRAEWVLVSWAVESAIVDPSVPCPSPSTSTLRSAASVVDSFTTVTVDVWLCPGSAKV